MSIQSLSLCIQPWLTVMSLLSVNKLHPIFCMLLTKRNLVHRKCYQATQLQSPFLNLLLFLQMVWSHKQTKPGRVWPSRRSPCHGAKGEEDLCKDQDFQRGIIICPYKDWSQCWLQATHKLEKGWEENPDTWAFGLMFSGCLRLLSK